MAITELPRFWLFVELLSQNKLVPFDDPYDLTYKPSVDPFPEPGNGYSYARRLCPGLYAYYCPKEPVRIALCGTRHDAAWVFGYVYPMPNGGSRLVYEHASFTKMDLCWQRKTAIAKYVRGQDVKLPEKLSAILPRITEGSLARKVFIEFDQRGRIVSEGKEPLDPPTPRLYRTDSPEVRQSFRDPILINQYEWEPAYRVLDLITMLRDELRTFGAFWFRPYAFREPDGSLTARLCLVAPGGESFAVSVGNEDQEPRLSPIMNDVLSWAASTISIRGPGL